MIAVTRPFSGESPQAMTPVARVDDELSQGRMPEDLVQLNYLDLAVHSGASRRAVELIPATSSHLRACIGARDDRLGYWSQTAARMVARGIIFGLGGAVILNLGLPVALTGLITGSIGAFSGWLKQHRELQGKVTIAHDGHTRNTHFHYNPQHYEHTPSELKTMLTAEGLLGDDIAAAPRPSLPATDAPMGQLPMLDADRRLVAPLGNKSRYGHDVLDLVDAEAARRLHASGRPVYVVTRESQQDVPRELSVYARTPNHKMAHRESHTFTERHISYRLTPFNGGPVEAGDGVPDGIVGVYEHAREMSLPVYRKAESDTGSISDKKESFSHTNFEQASAADVTRAGSVRNHWITRMDLRFPIMMVGALIGGIAANGLYGATDPGMSALLMGGGALGGRLLGFGFMETHLAQRAAAWLTGGRQD